MLHSLDLGPRPGMHVSNATRASKRPRKPLVQRLCGQLSHASNANAADRLRTLGGVRAYAHWHICRFEGHVQLTSVDAVCMHARSGFHRTLHYAFSRREASRAARCKLGPSQVRSTAVTKAPVIGGLLICRMGNATWVFALEQLNQLGVGARDGDCFFAGDILSSGLSALVLQ